MFLSKYGLIERDQNKYGIKPISSPNQNNLLNKKFFFKYIYGKSDNKGTNTRKVFIIKDKPIQIPKRRMYSLLSLFLILTKENNPIVTKDE